MDQQQKLGEAVYQYDIRALIARVKNSEMFIYEAAEKIECLRYLENGVTLRMVVTEYMGVEIDTPEDLIKAAKLL